MFLIRVTFWLALIVLLLPTDKSAQERLYTAASETARRVATFCDRNATVCARGGEYWAVFKHKLDFGAKLAYEVASERLMGKSAPAVDPISTSATPPAKVERAKGTLSPSDVQPEWRGKPAKSGA
ncbi:MAG: DUF5330 domain-containing protein [Hyphomicrobiaceae bacterium]